MIHFTQGNLLKSNARALVNTVNTVGVMGKGIALQFKNTFPLNYKLYQDACKNGKLTTGQLLVVHENDLLRGEKIIINFPTKQHWKQPSTYEYIESGLVALQIYLIENPVESLAMPALGCGNGGLDWEVVKPMIVEYLSDIDTEFFVYEPL
ncbi:macro domain-containing protein [Mucilaginibacter sp. OK283]|jgi:O-acetyl-ADP-ribose deacetylase (regulator of RNase III)|uniref:macro domain-containing protein n=1 Tax=Mucilaginibacter sp. OK283 TaxID=1881049 RepID=UPI0008C274DB|nr:macro domain-containing protein [Mucilaginibacter sp. OK283]SEO79130.1 O-acetyl-ADP-ribose deacetylase (regulator of RNase III), contains Macro domain [Mucilaginibacter sp. OK283]